MSGSWAARNDVPFRAHAPWFLTVLALLGFAPAASAQSADSVATPSRDVFYADVWTPRDRTGMFHLHGGVFLPAEANATSATLGMRLGLMLGGHVALGVSGDWTYKSKNLLEAVDSGLPGFEPKLQLAKVDAHLVPAMVFLQVKLTERFPVVPYAGVGAGYEWLFLRASDYRTGESATSTYANIAWQSYAGVGLRLSPGLRLDTELYYNGGLLKRDIDEGANAGLYETVNVNGVGARVGLEVLY